jgi:hypothetical protein
MNSEFPTLKITIEKTDSGKYRGHIVLSHPIHSEGLDATSSESENEDDVKQECESLVSLIRLQMKSKHSGLNVVWE